jgi:hypothetical protein
LLQDEIIRTNKKPVTANAMFFIKYMYKVQTNILENYE